MKLFRRSAVRAYLETVERSRVVVHTRGGASIEGVLTNVYPDCLVLEHASYLSAGGRTTIDGEAIIERAKVEWIQKLGPGEEA